MELAVLREEIVSDLTTELLLTDANFSRELLEAKVRAAIREVMNARRYPGSYSEDRISADMENYYINIRNIALYDYNMIGAEGQKQSSENGIARVYVDRGSLFSGITPIARVY